MIDTLLQNRYRLDVELGQGGMGTIYRATDMLLEREVAVKLLSASGLGTEGRARLLREAQAVARLNHPHIVSVYDAGESNGTPFLVMELVTGDSLRERPPQSLEETLHVARQLCDALDHAHKNGVVHRDLKPENVVMTPEGVAKLIDFGLARSSTARVSLEGTLVGTVSYLAPEQALGQAIDGRTDLYALGVMLYELTAGRLPFMADDPIAVISQHLYAPVVPPSTYNSGILPALDSLIVQLMSKEREDRPASAVVVSQALEQIGRDSGSTATQTAVEPVSPLARIARGRFVARQHEMTEALRLWQQAVQGQGQVLLISGEPGVGKTRLARELMARAQVGGAIALVGECFAEGTAPYAPLAQLIRATDLSGVSPPIVADLLTIAPTLRMLYPDVPPNQMLEPQAERQRIFDNVAAFLALLSERAPVLLFIDDVHWADSGSLFLLHHLARRVRNLRALIVLTYREVELSEARPFHEMLLDLNRERLATRLKLPRFNREQTCDLLAVLFQKEITAEFLDGIYRETDGNPFFVEEVCKALIESGKLTREGGQWRRPAMEEIEIPQSVRVAIELRVARLPLPVQDTLRAAAILGREFEFEVLRAMGDLDEDELIDALEVAEHAQLIAAVKQPGAISFAFAHALIPLTLHEGLSAPRRQRLHRRAAQAIERVTERADRLSSGDFAAALGRHYAEAGDLEKAVEYYLQAGERARGVYAYQEAIGHYRHALTALKEIGPAELTRAVRTAMTLGQLYHTIFDFEHSQQAYQEGFALWQRVEEDQRRVMLPPAPHALRLLSVGVRCLDLTATALGQCHRIIQQLFSGLVECTPDLDIVPDLARSWEILDQGRRYVFHLRPEARWSDGHPVTAHDFEFTWKHQLNPANPFTGDFLFDIKSARACYEGRARPDEVGVHAIDDHTLAVELEEPVGHFLDLLAYSATFAIPRHVVEAHGQQWATAAHIVTNGPFRLEAWRPDDRIVLVRNPDYHGRATGNVTRVEVALSDHLTADAQVALYEGGACDVCEVLSYRTTHEIEQVRRQHASEYVGMPLAHTGFVSFDVRVPPFDDVRVRQAFVHALDRVTMTNTLFGNYRTPATGGLVPPGLPGHSAGIGLPYDPKRARQLLAEAGYADGRGLPTLEAWVCSTSEVPPDVRYMTQQWHDILGIDIHWTCMDWHDWREQRRGQVTHLLCCGWLADYPDPSSYLSAGVHFYTWSSWRDVDYEQLLDRARRMADLAERIKMYRAAERILIQEAVFAPLSHRRQHLLIKPWIRRYPINPLKANYWKDVIIEAH